MSKIIGNESAEAEIIADYAAGASLARIAAKHGTSPYTVRMVLYRHEVEPRPAGAPSILPKEEVAREYLAGASSWKLAPKYGVTPTAIRQCIANQGIKLRPAHSRNSTISDETLQELASHGLSKREISYITDRSYSNVSNRLARLGLTEGTR